jgi:hypothetical protein
MGIFRALENLFHAAANVEDVKSLERAADHLIYQSTGILQTSLPKQFRSLVSEKIKSLYLNNFGPPYEAPEIAAMKLLCYKAANVPIIRVERLDEGLRLIASKIDLSRGRDELTALWQYR